ncbi:LOW QUALITY PROTEIN: hypothetical protein BDA96_09G214300 [Sorghum bicolor]|uniref:Late embryogenesis abundant protein LEA-2 subgroup domain-containing protein n=1 Tax=Sorghum bicolor TaxID=4558 RepID=A0A921QD47_SORBI|nr:LOW QUALITY PROTEIN: hypothetical protein BDA96_09G214300 [Sorghum bicolor]
MRLVIDPDAVASSPARVNFHRRFPLSFRGKFLPGNNNKQGGNEKKPSAASSKKRGMDAADDVVYGVSRASSALLSSASSLDSNTSLASSSSSASSRSSTASSSPSVSGVLYPPAVKRQASNNKRPASSSPAAGAAAVVLCLLMVVFCGRVGATLLTSTALYLFPRRWRPATTTRIVFAVLNLRGRGCCCRLLCCAVVTAVVLAVLAAAAVGALYLALDPKAPRYSVDRLSVSAFQVDPSMVTARARFDVTVTAANPNSRIGIQYEPGSSLGVWYQSYRLERGALPAFYQGHRNTTVLPPALAGEVQLATAVVSGRAADGAVPLVFRADVPVRVEVGSFKGREKSSQS